MREDKTYRVCVRGGGEQKGVLVVRIGSDY